MAEKLGEQIRRYLAQMKAKRSPNENVWRNCFEYSFPSRVDGFSGEIRDAQTTQTQLSKLFDSTLAESSQILVSAIQSGMTPANAVWVGFEAAGQTDEEAAWFDAAAEIIWQNIHASNFDSEDFEATTDMTAAGFGCLFVDVNRDEGGYVFEWWPVSGCYIGQSKAGGKVDTLYRPYKMTAEQAAKQFSLPGDTLPQHISEKLETDPGAEFEIIHALYPRKDKKPGMMARNLPFASCHVCAKTGEVIRESGFHEQPFVVFRWSVLPNSPYAMGPMSIALPDARTLNEVKRLQLANLDMAVSGMWIAEDDGVLNPRTVKVGARKIIVANSVDSMRPLQPSTNWDVAFLSEEKLQAQIKRVMMADHITPRTSGPVETAAAVYERIALIRQLLGPLYGRMQSEKLKTLVERCFGLAMRAGILPPIPDSLRGKVAHVTYKSPFARAQKLEEVSAIERAFASAAGIAQATGQQDVMDELDPNKAVREITHALGVDKITRSDAEKIVIRKQRENAQAAASQQAMLAPAIQEAGKAAGGAIGQQMVEA